MPGHEAGMKTEPQASADLEVRDRADSVLSIYMIMYSDVYAMPMSNKLREPSIQLSLSLRHRHYVTNPAMPRP